MPHHPTATSRQSARSPKQRRAQLAVVPDPSDLALAEADAEKRARGVLAAAELAGAPLVTPTGRPRSPATLAEYRRGRAPANKGKRYPAEVLTVAEVCALLDAFPGGPGGARSRALVVLLWRSGLRVAEALALRVQDVDFDLGAITVLCGKGAKRRVVGIDAQALEYLREWLREREHTGIPLAAQLFCTVSNDGGGRGRPLTASAFRGQLKRYARKAGIAKRVHPHGFRHTHAFELANEAIPLHVIQSQLGHESLSMTAHYVDHLAPQQVIQAISNREWPGGNVPVPAVTRAAGSQGAPAPLRDPQVVPAYSPAPREPAVTALERKPGRAAPAGAAMAKILEVLRANGGRATQSQLARALKVKAKGAAVRGHCEELAAAGELVRLGELPRPNGGRPYVIWALPALRAVYSLDPTTTCGAQARRGHGAARVLAAIERLGGRASQSQLGGELGINSETVGVHCRALEHERKLVRGGLDKSTSNRGSQVWKLPGHERFHTTSGPMLQLSATSSIAGGGSRNADGQAGANARPSSAR